MDFFTGQVVPMATTYAPKYMAACDGRQIPINQAAALYSLIGLTYGGSGGLFAVPNLQGRAPVGFGTGGSVLPLGALGGEESHALTTDEMPQHLHTVAAATIGNSVSGPADKLPGMADKLIYGPMPGSPTPLGGSPVGNAGGGAPHSNMQPTLAVTMAIMLSGIYPSRG